MQTIIISGNLGKDPELRTPQGGNDPVCSFNVGVRQGFDRDAASVWYRCSIWGKSGEAAHQRLRKGSRVSIIGQLKIGEYQGKPQYDIRVVDWDGSAPKAEAGEQRQEQRGGGGGGFSGDDLDDDVPFGSPYLPRDHRNV
jgi:single-strand DNA-binding protein